MAPRAAAGLVLLLCLAVVPFNLIALPAGLLDYDSKRITQLLVITGTLAAFALIPGLSRRLGGETASLPVAARVVMAAVFGLGCLSAVRAPFPGYALLEVGLVAGLVLLAFAVAALLRATGTAGRVLFLIALMVGITPFVGDFLAGYLWATFARGLPIEWISPFPDFANVRFFSQVQTWTLPLLPAAYLLARGQNRILGGLVGLIAGCCWGLQFATGTRGTWVAVVLATLVTLLAFRGGALPWLKRHGGLAALGGLVYAVLFRDRSPGPERAVETSGRLDEGRIELWQHALERITAQPWLGTGPMHFASGGAPNGFAHPHNGILQLASEWGLPAALLAVTALIWALARHIRAVRMGPAPWVDGAGTPAGAWLALWHPALLASVLGGVAHAMVSGVTVMPASQTVGVVVIGALIATRPVTAVGRPTSRVRGLGRAGLAAAVIGSLWLPIGKHLGHLEQAETDVMASEGQLNPRFWLQGRLNAPPWQAEAERT